MNRLKEIYVKEDMKWRPRTLEGIADIICGNFLAETSFFPYRSSSKITAFFQEAETDFVHDGSTRKYWVAETLTKILNENSSEPLMPTPSFARIIQTLMDRGDATNEPSERTGALRILNVELAREGFEAFYAEDKKCYLRQIDTNKIPIPVANPHRPFSKEEAERRDRLAEFLDDASEDEMTEMILLPLFRQLGFQRITAAGHKDKSLEYGKDIWMKYILPTLHVLYFGIQAKKGKLDAAGVSQSGNSNIAEVHNQLTMMLGHEIFDPETSRRVLVDHAFIVAGGEITKAAKNWIGNKLDATKRSQIMFMDRDDILNLCTVTNLPVPNQESENFGSIDSLPF